MDTLHEINDKETMIQMLYEDHNSIQYASVKLRNDMEILEIVTYVSDTIYP